jgi:hypothetical protein
MPYEASTWLTREKDQKERFLATVLLRGQMRKAFWLPCKIGHPTPQWRRLALALIRHDVTIRSFVSKADIERPRHNRIYEYTAYFDGSSIPITPTALFLLRGQRGRLAPRALVPRNISKWSFNINCPRKNLADRALDGRRTYCRFNVCIARAAAAVRFSTPSLA